MRAEEVPAPVRDAVMTIQESVEWMRPGNSIRSRLRVCAERLALHRCEEHVVTDHRAPSDDDIEAVARAMWDAAATESKSRLPTLSKFLKYQPWEEASDENHRSFRTYARVAIETWEGRRVASPENARRGDA